MTKNPKTLLLATLLACALGYGFSEAVTPAAGSQQTQTGCCNAASPCAPRIPCDFETRCTDPTYRDQAGVRWYKCGSRTVSAPSDGSW